MLGPEVRSEAVEGVTLWSIATDSGRSPSGRGAHLLQAYDELVVGYTESRYLGDPRASTARAAWRDRSLPNGVVLLNGGLAGLWRRSVAKNSIRVEVLLYDPPKRADATALEAAASELGRFFGRAVALEARPI